LLSWIPTVTGTSVPIPVRFAASGLTDPTVSHDRAGSSGRKARIPRESVTPDQFHFR